MPGIVDDFDAIRRRHADLYGRHVNDREEPDWYGISVPEQSRRMELPVSEGGVALTEAEREAVGAMYNCNTKRCGYHKSKKCLIAGHCVP